MMEKAYYAEETVSFSCDALQEHGPGILDLLYKQYQESIEGDSFLSKMLFQQQCWELRTLDSVAFDRILTLVCALCGDYEKEAYLAGIRAGARLCNELSL